MLSGPGSTECRGLQMFAVRSTLCRRTFLRFGWRLNVLLNELMQSVPQNLLRPSKQLLRERQERELWGPSGLGAKRPKAAKSGGKLRRGQLQMRSTQRGFTDRARELSAPAVLQKLCFDFSLSPFLSGRPSHQRPVSMSWTARSRPAMQKKHRRNAGTSFSASPVSSFL